MQSDSLLIPALKFCNQLARWTGNSAIDKVMHQKIHKLILFYDLSKRLFPLSKKSPSFQGKVGISATLFLEALSGESVSSPLELHNEGSTVIFYQWERLKVSRSLAKLRSYTRNKCFYFNQSSGE